MSKNQKIHPNAIVHDGAVLGDNVEVGPFSIIGENVKLADGNIVGSNVIIDGHCDISENNQFYPFVMIGGQPQDLTYANEPTKVIIGKSNIFREYVSIHRGTMKDKKVTTVGDESLLMSYVHLGHDVTFGSKCIIANSTNFAGHVNVGDNVIIGGGCNIGQFVTLGRGSYIGGASGLDRDVPTFCTAYGNRIKLKGINIIGMRRQGFSKQVISEVVDFFRLMEASPLSPRAFVNQEDILSEYQNNEIIDDMVGHIKGSEIGIAPFMS
jgi:UDP-N-acetylglucosamine acyltransferase